MPDVVSDPVSVGISDIQTGKFIALEGTEGSGKTTQTRQLAKALGALETYEPGNTAVGELIRQILLNPSSDPNLNTINPKTETLLFLAARASHVSEVIKPAIRRGRWVVCDRFAGSTYAYQGFGRGLDLGTLKYLSNWTTDGIEPDLNIFLDVEWETANTRRCSLIPDRLEKESKKFHLRVIEGFKTLANSDPEHWAVINGNNQQAKVANDILLCVKERFAC
ncbi:MAG: dTMP kinase [Actinobacteria bacterium]|nr:dTMP kinase [Actinomycetota bacterium]MCL6104310.1 dTMP kinase [Actinomycetota bacterium]